MGNKGSRKAQQTPTDRDLWITTDPWCECRMRYGASGCPSCTKTVNDEVQQLRDRLREAGVELGVDVILAELEKRNGNVEPVLAELQKQDSHVGRALKVQQLRDRLREAGVELGADVILAELEKQGGHLGRALNNLKRAAAAHTDATLQATAGAVAAERAL